MSMYCTTINLEDLLKDAVISEVKNVYLRILYDEIENEQARMIKRIEERSEECRLKARETAYKMAFTILQRANLSGISVEFKI